MFYNYSPVQYFDEADILLQVIPPAQQKHIPPRGGSSETHIIVCVGLPKPPEYLEKVREAMEQFVSWGRIQVHGVSYL